MDFKRKNHYSKNHRHLSATNKLSETNKKSPNKNNEGDLSFFNKKDVTCYKCG